MILQQSITKEEEVKVQWQNGQDNKLKTQKLLNKYN